MMMIEVADSRKMEGDRGGCEREMGKEVERINKSQGVMAHMPHCCSKFKMKEGVI